MGLRQGLCIFMKSQNLWNFAFEKKIKTKPKALAWRIAGNPSDFRAALIIAEPLCFIMTNH